MVCRHAMTWAEIDWAVLARLRTRFLSSDAAPGPYWTSPADLANYDFTFGQRIAWKWDAVLQELDQRHWMPRPAAVLDWGCGSGVAGRRVIRWLGADRATVLRVWDHSALATDFAARTAQAAFPELRVERVAPGFLASGGPVGVLVVSHVLNELPAAELLRLRELAERADAILWVEPGTPEVSRLLIDVREQMRGRFQPVAPCTHHAACGLLAPDNARHWCHHFASPPPQIFTDTHWVKFARRAGIDLRSLPCSFIVLARRPENARADADPSLARVIGEPRIYKGFAKVLSCDATGVAEFTVQKRDAPGLFKQLKQPAGAPVYRWTRTADRIHGGQPLVG
jgi:hypothetical protein